VIANAGTLGILIPPSIVMVVYAAAVEVSVGRMFLAGVIPGLLAGGMLMTAIYVMARFRNMPKGDWQGWGEIFASGRDAAWGLFLIVIILGGIYGGIFTPTEAAAVGTLATGLLAAARGMRLTGLAQCIYGAAEATGMIFLILLGADVLNVFLALTQMPAELAHWIGASGLPPMMVLASMIALYIALGCVMDSLSMILLTVPIFFPIVMGLDYWGLGATDKAIWFGIIALMVVEIGLITPPVGMNVYIINSLARGVPMAVTFRGVVPFLVSDALRVVLVVSFPTLSLALVHVLSR